MARLLFDDYIIKRYAKIAAPSRYLAAKNPIEDEEIVAKEKLPLEFMLNALRLFQPIKYSLLKIVLGLQLMPLKNSCNRQ